MTSLVNPYWFGGGGAPPFSETPHRYWAVDIAQATNDTFITQLNEIEMRASVSGGDLCISGTAFASSSFSGSAPADAFDGDVNTGWTSNTGGFPARIGWDFGAGNEQAPLELALWGRNDSYVQVSPKEMEWIYSDDGSNYSLYGSLDDVFSSGSATDWGIGENRVFPFDGSPYDANTHWRVYCRTPVSGGILSFLEIEMAAAAGANLCTGGSGSAFGTQASNAQAFDGNTGTAAQNSSRPNYYCGWAFNTLQSIREMRVFCAGNTGPSFMAAQFRTGTGTPNAWKTAAVLSGLTWDPGGEWKTLSW